MSKKKTAKKRAATAPEAKTSMSTLPQAKMPVSTPLRAPSTAKSSKPAPIVAASTEAIARAQAGFADEYRYVLGDLKRIGVLAVSMFVLLGALALIVR
jgi:hypothetical protein